MIGRSATVFLAVLAAAGAAHAQDAPRGTASALALLQSQRFGEAAALLDSITRASPDDARAWMLLGSAHRSARAPAKALEAHRRALAFEATAPDAMYQTGLDHALLGSIDSAFHWLRQARETNRVDLTQLGIDPAAETLRDDARYLALMPSEAEFAHPFVEPVTIVREWRGEAANDQFGWIARNAGDVDADGLADVLVSAPTHGGDRGKVYVYSTGTGALLWSRIGEPGERLGLGIAAAGDADDDGVPDVAAGGPTADVVYVLGGRDGRVIHRLSPPQPGEQFGRKLAPAGDLDGDGHDDLLVGAPASAAAGRDAGAVYAISGRTGAVLHRFDGAPGDKLGVPASGRHGDVTLIALGAADAGPAQAGAVPVYRGLAAEPAFVIRNDSGGVNLGAMFVSVVGDVDADGVPDVYGSDWAHGAAGPFAGRVFVHSGADGRRLYTFTGETAGDGYGIGTADVGDVNGDGHDDLLVGAWRHSGAAPVGGKLYVHSGRDGTLLRTVTGRVMGETLGFDTTGLGDVTGDGAPDFLVTSAWSAIAGTRSGRVYVISGSVTSPAAPPGR